MGRKEMHTVLWWEFRREKDDQEVIDVGGRIILKLDLRFMRWCGMDWIRRLAEHRDQWRTLVNTVMNCP
jgi:hypothetical protein